MTTAIAAHEEVEVKLRVAHLGAFKRQLGRIGARLGKRVHEYNILFDTADRKLRRSDCLLRLRLNDGAGLVTFKGPPLAGPRGRAGRYKVRRETELRVSDPAAAAALFSQWAYQPTFRYEKYRTEIAMPGRQRAHVVLDETPIGTFLEIEGPPDAIDRAARKLGYQPSDYETRSYLALYASYCRRRKRPLRDLLFTRRKKRRKGSVSR